MESVVVHLLLDISLIAYSVYIFYIVIQRLYLSPIASIPGPRLAALTFWYEFYYDVVKGGKYTWRIAQMHDRYGSIVRINPFEIHVNHPNFYNALYVHASESNTEAWSCTVPMFRAPDSTLATIDHDLHQRRRNAYINYFHPLSIRKYSILIQTSVDKLCARLKEFKMKGEKVNLVHAYSALAGDVVTGYCFPESYHLLDEPYFAPEFSELWKLILCKGHILKQFPSILPTMLKFPSWFVDRFLPDLAIMYQWQRVWTRQIMDIKSGDEKPGDEVTQSSIFRTLLESDLPPQDKSTSRLLQEAQTIVGGGSETTARTLAVGTYHILSNKHVLESLLSELHTVIPQDKIPSVVELETLPYLTACVFESLRISSGVTHRLQRVCPDQYMRFADRFPGFPEYMIPPGTPISMTSTLIHNNPDIFPAPRKFRPERWLPLETTGKHLHQYLVSFSKGSRQCLGMNLVYAELHMTLAVVLRRFGQEMKVVDTVRERDVDVVHDMFTGFPSMESKGIFVEL